MPPSPHAHPLSRRERWQRELADTLTDPAELAARFGVDPGPLARVARVFPLKISRYYLSLIERPGDPIWRQCVPDPAELAESGDLMRDPLGEEGSSPAPNLVHRYPDHCLLLVSGTCATHCRFCTRKRKFAGCCGAIDGGNLEPAFRYIASHGEIRDVLVSGGDPLLLADDALETILRRLRSIPHVEIVRIGTRAPCTLPSRVTPRLARMLRRYHPLYLNLHFNHPKELTDASRRALARLADAGIPLSSQTVLLRGVNDSPEVLKELFEGLLRSRVRPYYLFQCDLVFGTEHFRTKLSEGPAMLRTLRGHTSGMAIPHFGLDLPGGGGKVALAESPLVGQKGNTLSFRNFAGQLFDYPDLAEG
jgi:lysine 2,3-aminomutase